MQFKMRNKFLEVYWISFMETSWQSAIDIITSFSLEQGSSTLFFEEQLMILEEKFIIL